MFRQAAQPDVVRSKQKDILYLQHFVDAAQEVSRRLLGPWEALKCTREIELLGRLLYYALTTGGGKQTLGEEYCDLIQVDRRNALPRRHVQQLLVVLQAVSPYLLDKFTSSLESSSLFTEPPDFEGDDPTRSEVGQLSTSTETSSPGLYHWCTFWGSALRAQLGQRLPAIRQALVLAERMHLALFYLQGVYYEWPKRILGVQYHSISSRQERSASYRILGVLLATQLAISLAMQSLNWSRQHKGHQMEEVNQAAALLPEDLSPDEVHPDVGRLQYPQRAQAPRPCPLCLAPRSHPTCPPCGHVFCWHCIAQWCLEKPECPLCRATAVPSQLVALYYSDF